MEQAKIPVTVLTGYLGAGKTTLLNRILSEPHGRKYAVIVNEFGELGIDNDLIVGADEEIFEMNNGCICCTVRGDLIRIIGGLMRRQGQFDGIIVETTGLADPAPVAQTFFVDDEVAGRTALDSIITVVDARHLPQRLRDSHEAEEQIAFADIVLVNKLDLVTPAELAAVEAKIRAINPFARILTATRGQVPIAQLLDQGSFDLNRILEREPDFLTHGHHHHHDNHVSSVSLVADRPLDAERFNTWIGELAATKGNDLLRYKGILAMAGSDARHALQGVHMMMESTLLQPWAKDEARRSRLVLIGRNLDAEALRAGFAGCVAVAA